METQINSFFKSARGETCIVRIFGYSTRGVPGVEVNGMGKLSKNIKEKLIYMTRSRKLSLPLRRFVICLDLNDLEEDVDSQNLKSLEFPILILFWQLAGFLPISRLDDCLCSGSLLSNGEISLTDVPKNIENSLKIKFNPIEKKALKFIAGRNESSLFSIDPRLLFQHIPNLSFK